MSQTTRKQLPAELADIKPPVQLRLGKAASYLLYLWVIIGVVSLGLRIFLLLFSANLATPFVNFVIRLSDDYLAPFRGIFPPHQVGENGYFDVAALFAIFVYLVLMWLASALIEFVQAKIDTSEHLQRRQLWYQQAAADKQTEATRVRKPSSR